MFLSQRERDKFAAYLKQEAVANAQMAEQMAKLPGLSTLLRSTLVDKQRRDAATFLHVAAYLESIKDQVIGEAAEAAERKET